MTLEYREIRRWNINSFFTRRCPRRRRLGCVNSLISVPRSEQFSESFCLRCAFLFALCCVVCVVLFYLRCAFPGYVLLFKIYVRTPALNRFVFLLFRDVFFFVCVFFFCLYWPFYLSLPSLTQSLFHGQGEIKKVYLLPDPRSPFRFALPVSVTSFTHSSIYPLITYPRRAD